MDRKSIMFNEKDNLKRSYTLYFYNILEMVKLQRWKWLPGDRDGVGEEAGYDY